MEVFFVRILNRTLVILGVIALASSIIAVLTAAIMFGPSLMGTSSPKQVTVTYTPLNEVSATISSPSATTSSSASTASAEATAVCNAKSKLVMLVTKNQLSIPDIPKCAEGWDERASDSYPARATNYLHQLAEYYGAIANDRQAATKYSGSEPDELSNHLADIDKEFNAKFSAIASKDDDRLESDAEKSIARSFIGYAALYSAGAAFFSFLVIAFLLVATRIEKHLSNIETKLPNA